ncbi:unnamed protein product [Timema podura]|uniref:Delta-aminolevulinic acid dehydratase n=1 Tax=Timema podura TaxID=61482 RepID=A0ABN7NX83_TIMPD|nr:unnamed protein product [Timema podura]
MSCLYISRCNSVSAHLFAATDVDSCAGRLVVLVASTTYMGQHSHTGLTPGTTGNWPTCQGPCSSVPTGSRGSRRTQYRPALVGIASSGRARLSGWPHSPRGRVMRLEPDIVKNLTTGPRCLQHALVIERQSTLIVTALKSSVACVFQPLGYISVLHSDAQDAVEMKSMPGVFEYSVHNLRDNLTPLINKGLKLVLLFGISNHLDKNDVGSNADSQQNPVIKVLPKLRTWFPKLIIATDAHQCELFLTRCIIVCQVCLCPYTEHGHCGILGPDGVIDNPASIERIAQIALAYAKAGAHIIAPSDMMDGRISAIKGALQGAGLGNKTAVLSYSAKFASGFYGPFRDVTKSAPRFGDRKCYQLPPGSKGLAARATARDVAEGCDMLMVKPGLAYLDIVKQTKDAHPEYPLFVYQVSGEYAMMYHAAKAGALDLRAVLEEVLLSMRRAVTPTTLPHVPLQKREKEIDKASY